MGHPHRKRSRPRRVAVLYGGDSAEREISIQSGRAVARALEQAGQTVVLIDPAETDLTNHNWSGIDVAFIALHGRFGEDGQVQQLLERAGVAYTGSDVQASRLAISKSAAKERFVQHGVPTAPYVLLHESDPAARILSQAERLGFPLVLKPDSQGSSIGVTVVRDAQALPEALARCFRYDAFGLLEPYLSGAEWTVGFIDEVALPLIRIDTFRSFFDFEAKYRDSSTRYEFDAAPPPLAQRITQAAAAACRALGTRGLTRVDLIVDRNEQPWVLEVNTVPGLTDHSLVPKAAARHGISFVELCNRCVQSAIHASPRPVPAPHARVKPVPAARGRQ
ncbi:MAG: D-alanine--D-alanine ligase [Planctomycetaceae bacterium]